LVGSDRARCQHRQRVRMQSQIPGRNHLSTLNRIVTPPIRHPPACRFRLDRTGPPS